MEWLRELARRSRMLAHRSRFDADLEDEMRLHLELRQQQQIASGRTAEQARTDARRQFGNVTLLAERSRAAWGFEWMDGLAQDLRYGLRILRKAPAFTSVALVSLALGIGANTAMFSIVYAVLLKPLPYAQSDRLFNVFEVQARQGVEGTGWSYPNFEEVLGRNRVFSSMAGAQHHQLTLTGRGEPSVVNTSVVTPQFFTLFGEQPLAGRPLSPDDGRPGAPPAAVLSENLWRARFGADPGIVGSSIALDQRSFTIVGIMPAAFRFPALTQSEQLWIPLAQDPLFGGWTERRGGHWLQLTGRLEEGISLAQARANMDAIGAALARQFPAENSGWSIAMLPLQDMFVSTLRPALFALLAAVGLVLLIACANIANLLLARATSRSKELAVRAALGAGRARIIRQLLSEAAVLGVLGGSIGIAFAYWGVIALGSLMPATLRQVNAIAVDSRVLGFALLLSAVASLLFGIAPAICSAAPPLGRALRETGRSGESGRGRRARGALAAAEIALALVLLLAAGLLLRSFSKLMSVHPGFDPERVVMADVSLPRFRYAAPQQWTDFAGRLLARIQARPGLTHSAVAVPLPIVQGVVNLGFDIVGTPRASASDSRTADYASVSPEYFRVMGIPLLSGRSLAGRDVPGAPPVTVISNAMAHQYFRDEDPVGRRLTFGFPPDPGTTREIVGVVGDVRDVSLGQAPGPMMYVPFAQAPFWGAGVVVKSTLPAAEVAAGIRTDVHVLDADLPVTDVAMLPDLLRGSVAEQRFRTLLLALFATTALLLAASGIFGVIAYSVSRRTIEIGIRVALGASRGAIVRMILRETFVLIASGVGVGIPCALGASYLARHLLFGVSAGDPATLAVAVCALGAVAALAGFVPARRAMRVDPMVALRYE